MHVGTETVAKKFKREPETKWESLLNKTIGDIPENWKGSENILLLEKTEWEYTGRASKREVVRKFKSHPHSPILANFKIKPSKFNRYLPLIMKFLKKSSYSKQINSDANLIFKLRASEPHKLIEIALNRQFPSGQV